MVNPTMESFRRHNIRVNVSFLPRKKKDFGKNSGVIYFFKFATGPRKEIAAEQEPKKKQRLFIPDRHKKVT